jgi:EmrB/QacA subfamily drug resistance transporter
MFSKPGTLAVVCLATAMLMLDIAVVNTALPHIARDLHAGLTGVQWVVDAYTLALATVVLSAGSIADRFGRRRIFIWGMGLFTLSSLACALAQSIAVLDGARAVQGTAAAMLFASSLAILADAYPGQAERAQAFALYGATIGASFALGPLVGGALTSGFSWQAVFYVNLPLGILALVAGFAWLRESNDPAPRRIDRPGQATLTAGLFLLVLALLRGNQEGWASTRILAELVGGGLLLLAFVLVERHAREPMLPLGLFRNRAFTGAQIAAFSISASFFALFLYLTLYLQEVLHLSPFDTGLVYLPGTILMFVVSAASAQLGDRTSPGALIGAGLILVAAGLVNPALAAVALGSVDNAQSGLAAGINDAFRQGGIAVGVAAFGALLPASAALGHGSPEDYVTGLHHALLIGAALAAAGGIATSRLILTRRTTSQTQPVAAVDPARS